MSNWFNARTVTLALGIAVLGTACERDPVEQAQEDVERQAEEVRERARELGTEVRELSQVERDAWETAAREGEYSVLFDPRGVVIATRLEPSPVAPPPDADLTQSVRQNLAAAPEPALQAITVSAESGVVTLTGSVPTLTDATTAVTSAIRTPGATRVVSQLSYGR